MWAGQLESARADRYTQDHLDWQRGLDAFRIPYLVQRPGGELDLSVAALSLLDRDAWRTAVCDQARQLAAQVTEAEAGSPSIGLPRLVRTVAACGLEHLSLSMHVLARRSDAARFVFVLGPCPSVGQPCAAYNLTGRELDVARLIAKGLANKCIAAELRMSAHTARRHTERVFAKLGVNTRASVASRMGHHVIGNGPVQL
jgi:DNA-binding CsgD family transcriptional regulator